jgi:hypothetical protein
MPCRRRAATSRALPSVPSQWRAEGGAGSAGRDRHVVRFERTEADRRRHDRGAARGPRRAPVELVEARPAAAAAGEQREEQRP